MEKLGINGIQLLAQLVNVGILIVVLKKFLFKPILNILDSRRAMAEDLERKEQELSARLDELVKKEQEVMKKAKVAADQILKDAQKEAKKANVLALKEAEEKAKIRLREVLKDAELTISQKSGEHARLIREEAVKLANEALRTLLPKESHLKITENQLTKLLNHA